MIFLLWILSLTDVHAHDALLGYLSAPIPSTPTVVNPPPLPLPTPPPAIVPEPPTKARCTTRILLDAVDLDWMSNVPVPSIALSNVIPIEFPGPVQWRIAQSLDSERPAHEVGAVIGWIRRVLRHLELNGLTPLSGHELLARRDPTSGVVMFQLDGRLRFQVSGIPLPVAIEPARVAPTAPPPQIQPVVVASPPAHARPLPVGTTVPLSMRRFRLDVESPSNVPFARVSPDGHTLIVPGHNNVTLASFRNSSTHGIDLIEIQGSLDPGKFSGATQDWTTVPDRHGITHLFERRWGLHGDGTRMQPVDRSSLIDQRLGWRVSSASSNGRSVLLHRHYPVSELFWIDPVTEYRFAFDAAAFGGNNDHSILRTGFSADGNKLWVLMNEHTGGSVKRRLFIVMRDGTQVSGQLAWQETVPGGAPIVQFSPDGLTLFVVDQGNREFQIYDLSDLYDRRNPTQPLVGQRIGAAQAYMPTAIEVGRSGHHFLFWSPTHLGIVSFDGGFWRMREVALEGLNTNRTRIRCLRLNPAGTRAIVGTTTGTVYALEMSRTRASASAPIRVAPETVSVDAVAFLPHAPGFFAVLGEDVHYSVVMLNH